MRTILSSTKAQCHHLTSSIPFLRSDASTENDQTRSILKSIGEATQVVKNEVLFQSPVLIELDVITVPVRIAFASQPRDTHVPNVISRYSMASI